MNGTSTLLLATASCGTVQRSSQEKRNPPVSQRDKRQRPPPLQGNNEFQFTSRELKESRWHHDTRITRPRPSEWTMALFYCSFACKEQTHHARSRIYTHPSRHRKRSCAGQIQPY